MIGLIVIGRHERLREAYKQVGSARGIVPSRLSEIDYVHPSDFAKVLSALPETLIRWTNNPAVLDAVPLDRVCVLTRKGPQPFLEHPLWAVQRGMQRQVGLRASDFWLVFGSAWEDE